MMNITNATIQGRDKIMKHEIMNILKSIAISALAVGAILIASILFSGCPLV